MAYRDTKTRTLVLETQEDVDVALAYAKAVMAEEGRSMRASETATRRAHNPENRVQFPGPLPTRG